MRCLLKILSCVYSQVRELKSEVRKRARSDSISERLRSRSDSVNEGDQPHKLSEGSSKSKTESTAGKQSEAESGVSHQESESSVQEGETSQTGSREDSGKQVDACDTATVEMLYEVIQNILTDVVLVLCEVSWKLCCALVSCLRSLYRWGCLPVRLVADFYCPVKSHLSLSSVY